MTVATRPIDVVLERLKVVHDGPTGFRAACPAHGSRGATLSISEATDGAVLIHCFAGCSTADVVRALGLEFRSLFPSVDTWRRRQDEISTARRQFRHAPRTTVRSAIERELVRTRAAIVAELRYARPLRSSDINAIRMRVARIYGVPLPPVAPFVWECPPHDDDPAWPALFERRLREVLIAEHGDPDAEPTREQCFNAADRAALDLHELARDGVSA